jgi:hypothetical protein
MADLLLDLRRRLAAKPADLAYVGGGTMILNRDLVQAFVEITSSARLVRDLAPTLSEFISDDDFRQACQKLHQSLAPLDSK